MVRIASRWATGEPAPRARRPVRVIWAVSAPIWTFRMFPSVMSLGCLIRRSEAIWLVLLIPPQSPEIPGSGSFDTGCYFFFKFVKVDRLTGWESDLSFHCTDRLLSAVRRDPMQDVR